MYIFKIGILIILLIVLIKLLIIFINSIKDIKNIKDLVYLKTDEFYIINKKSYRRNNIPYRYVSIVDSNGEYEDTISYSDDLESYKLLKIGDCIGSRDIYIHPTINRLYKTTLLDLKPDLSGKLELSYTIGYGLIIFILLVAIYFICII